jgi:hypothetical protein
VTSCPSRVADPHHLTADPDPAFYFYADPDPYQSYANLQQPVYRPFRAPFEPPLCVHGSPRLHFEPLKLRNFDFNADPNPAFHADADPDPASIRIRIRNPGSTNNSPVKDSSVKGVGTLHRAVFNDCRRHLTEQMTY